MEVLDAQEEHNGAKGHLPPPCEFFLTKDPTSPKAIWVVHKALLREVFLLCEEEGSGGPTPPIASAPSQSTTLPCLLARSVCFHHTSGWNTKAKSSIY